MRRKSITLPFLSAALLLAAPANAADEEDTHGRDAWVPPDLVGGVYQEHCAVCHGNELQGAAQGPALVGAPLLQGDSVEGLVRSIAEGKPEKGMPAWAGIFADARIRSFALYILEKRARPASQNEHGLGGLPEIPNSALSTELHDIRLETLAEDVLHPYAIAPLPGGDVLLTERTRGLRVVSADGKVSEPILGTPRVHTDGVIQGYTYTGLGWMLD
ncbi:MAG: c-type cytochrome, partial [Myxococcota bacterium]